MSETVGTIGLGLEVDSRGFESSLRSTAKDAEGKAESIFSGLGKKINAALMITALAEVTKQLADFGKECLELGSDLAEVQNVVDVTFGSMAQQINDWSKSAMTNFGLSETVAKKYAGTFGAMAKAFGFANQDLVNLSENLAGLSGDVASFYNLSTDEAYTKLKSVFTGETEALKELGIVMTQTALDQYAMANGFGKTTKEMSEQEKVMLRYQFVTSQLSSVQGDFARTSGSWANQVRILSLQFDSLKASIGQGLINVLTPAIKLLNVLMGYLNKVAEKFRDFTSMFFGNAGSSGSDSVSNSLVDTANATNDINNALSGTVDSTKKISDSTKKTKDNLKEAVRTLMGFDEINKLSSVADAIADATAAANPKTSGISSGSGGGIGSIGTSFDQATSGASKLEGVIKRIKKELEKLPKLNFDCDWDLVRNNLESGFKNMLKTAGNIFRVTATLAIDVANDLDLGNLVEAMSETFRSSMKLTEAVTDAVGDAIIAFYETGLSEIVQWIGEKVADSFRLSAEVMDSWADWFKKNKEPIKTFGEILGDCVAIVWNLIEPLADLVWENFRNEIKLINAVAQLLLECFLGLAEKIRPVTAALREFTESPSEFKFAIKGVIDKSWEKVIDVWDGVKGGAKELVIKAKGVIDSGFDAVKEVFAGIKSNTKEFILKAKGVIDATFDKAKNTFNNLKAGTKDLLVKAKGTIDATFNSAKKTWDAFKSGTKNVTVTLKGNINKAFNDLKKAWDGIKNKTISIATKLPSQQNVTNGMKSLFKNAANGVIEMFNKVIGKMNSLMSITVPKNAMTNFMGLSGTYTLASVPKLSKLAQGGYVGANMPQLAIIGDNTREGEIVAPESKMMAMAMAAAQLSGGNNSAEIIKLLKIIADKDINLDGKKITASVISNVKKETNRTGKNPILT